MSVLVKGYTKPKGCKECKHIYPYFNQAWACSGSWCPLVKIPTPHGRLIDADLLMYKIQQGFCLAQNTDFHGIVTAEDVVEEIECAESIVEAEQSGL